MVLTPSGLLHLLQPVGIVVVHLIFREGRVVVQLRNIAGHVAHLRIEVFFFHHHGVLVTVQHLIALGLIGARQTERIADARLTTRTALGLDLDDTIRTLRTPDGSSSSILQYADALDILGVDVQQLCELLFVHVAVDGLTACLPDITINNNQRLTGTIDGRYTTQTHGSTTTEVT